jgi:hypothetical protein
MMWSMDPNDAVQAFRVQARRQEVIAALVGGIRASELRKFCDALISGDADPRPQVRWGCLRLLDHLPEPSVLAAICQTLDDPVPRVRRQAAHALGCGICKPAWDGSLPAQVVAKLTEMASSDSTAKVRAEARGALTCEARAPIHKDRQASARGK